MDQRLIAGLGNIYVCEALWRARLSPDRQGRDACDQDRQADARREAPGRRHPRVLDAAIEAGGSSLRDHIRADGELGDFQHDFAVYDREGEPCLRKDAAASSAAWSIPAARPSIVRSASADGYPPKAPEFGRFSRNSGLSLLNDRLAKPAEPMRRREAESNAATIAA